MKLPAPTRLLGISLATLSGAALCSSLAAACGSSSNDDAADGGTTTTGDSGTNASDGGADGTTPDGGNGEPACPAGSETTVKGRVFAPDGKLPLYNVVVFAPTEPLAPIVHGPTCERCGAVSGKPAAATVSGADGSFTLTNVPAGKDVRIAIQSGKWRREIRVPEVKRCETTTLSDPEQTRLPRRQSEGDMPRIAITTGACDELRCAVRGLGIDEAEIGIETDGAAKSVHVYERETSVPPPAGTIGAETLWSSQAKLDAYDLIAFTCDCSEGLASKGGPTGMPFTYVTNYLKKGGRILTTDFMYTWFLHSPDPELRVATDFVGNSPTRGLGMAIDGSFPKGAAMKSWLDAQGALDGGVLTTDHVAGNIGSATKAKVWAVNTSSTPGPAMVSLNVPTSPASAQCGKAIHLDSHTHAPTGTPYPGVCGASLTPAENALVFSLFDLGSCVQDDGVAPAPPKVGP
ncbi:MAG: hypothetical protein JST00_34305 [Deltaproteobacteria bacterium]|nr:hypothetical protein [Deltaproteobacteria bacterium]